MALKKSPKARPGRAPLQEGVASIPITVRMTPAQKEKFALLGGARWVRACIAKAGLPKPKP
jgi:hypothetical protein